MNRDEESSSLIKDIIETEKAIKRIYNRDKNKKNTGENQQLNN